MESYTDRGPNQVEEMLKHFTWSHNVDDESPSDEDEVIIDIQPQAADDYHDELDFDPHYLFW